MSKCSRFVLLLFASVLSACNGSGNSSMQDQAPRAIDDQFTAATATDSTLDVLANDRDPSGMALTIVSVQGAGQATLSIVGGNRILYRPACCSLTTDQFTYTVQNTQGRQASAIVRINVQRRIALTLQAPDLASVTQATVRIGGEAPLSATVSGNTATLTLDLRSDDALVRADLSNNPRLTLVSVLGSVPELVKRTQIDGRIGPSNWVALEVAPFTTSLAGTVQAGAGGALPTTQGPWDAAIAALSDWEGVTRRALFLDDVLQAGESALPAGATLFGLAGDPVRTELLIDAAPPDPTPRRDLFPADLFPIFPTNLTPQNLWLFRGGTHVDELALKLELGGSGSGSGFLVGPRGAIPINWDNQGVLNVHAAGPVPAVKLADSGLLARRGAACDFVVPRIFEWFDRVSIGSLSLVPFAYSQPDAEVSPGAFIASVGGEKTKGFSLSGCQPQVEPADTGPSFPFKVWVGSPAPLAGLTFTPGRWLIPYFGVAVPGRPLGQSVVDVAGDGSGAGPGALHFTSQLQSDGSLRIDYPTVGFERLYPIARFGNVFRVLVESQRDNGERRVDEAWIAKRVDPIDFASRLKNVRLRGCCRVGQLRVLRFDAQGAAFYDDVGPNPVPANITIDPTRGTLSIPSLPQDVDPPLVIVDPVTPLGDGRYLTFSIFSTEAVGAAEVVTLEPVPGG